MTANLTNSLPYGRKTKANHPTVRSVSELAVEFGTKPNYLNKLIREQDELEVSFKTGLGVHSKNYYNLADARKWWAKRKEEKSLCSKLAATSSTVETSLNG
jgi:hypothetical protein